MLRYICTLATAVVLTACSDDQASDPAVDLTDSEESQPTSDVTAVTDNERYDNPVDKKTYVAEGGWTEYKPKEPRPAAESNRIHNGGVRLLTAQDAIAERTSVESLAAFIERAEASAQSTLEEVRTQATVMVQFMCTPEKHEVQLAHQGDISQDQMQSFYDELIALGALPVTSGEVSFQLTIQIDAATEE